MMRSAITEAIMRLILCALLSITCLPSMIRADTFYLKGRLASDFQIRITKAITAPAGVRTLYVELVEIPSFQSPTFTQQVHSQNHTYSVPPIKIEQKTDAYGNRYRIARWDPAPHSVTVVTTVDLSTTVQFPVLEDTNTLPLSDIPPKVARYLELSSHAQHDDPLIRQHARELVTNAKTQHEAVTAIINWVVDHTTYTLVPTTYDAVNTLKIGRGNCQNFSNLSVALLRAVGIPARVATGFSTKANWSVERKNGEVYTLGMADGRHAWLEVYYPELGWIEYDAQQSLAFVSTRYLRQTVGADSRNGGTDGTYGWRATRGSGAEPRCRETIEVTFRRDEKTVQSDSNAGFPTNHLFGPLAAVTPEAPAPSVAADMPAAPQPTDTANEWTADRLQQLSFSHPTAFGNLDFPETFDVFAEVDRPDDEQGVASASNYVVESAEYVTGPTRFAQLFEIDRPLLLADISLVMHKFAGTDGELWIELADDANGRPATNGVLSDRLVAGETETGSAYSWVTFTFQDQQSSLALTPGRYWIILHYSGDAIFNWFYIYGNPTGTPDDTRSRSPDRAAWNTILNYDLNFRVQGFMPPQ